LPLMDLDAFSEYFILIVGAYLVHSILFDLLPFRVGL
jgi:hypothetical protein